MISSSTSAQDSMSLSCHSVQTARSSAGISIHSNFWPFDSSSKTAAFILMRSTIPRCWSSSPSGHWTGTGFVPRRSFMLFTHMRKSAPTLSILFMNATRGTLYLSAWRHTVSLCGSTPLPPSNTATAPSSTRRLRSTSMVKSTCPGVSMMLMRFITPPQGPSMGRQKQLVAAEVIVIPRSCSWTM